MTRTHADEPSASPAGPVHNLHLVAGDLREAFTTARYDADGVLEALGADAHAALGRGEPVPVRRASTDLGALGTLIRLLLIGDDCHEREAAAALGPVDLDAAVHVGLLDRDGPRVRAAVDVRPLDAGHGTRWLFSDLDGSMRPVDIAPDHVLGVGHASLSLLRASVPSVGSVLDVGTGCGVQAVHALDGAARATATDITERALAMTRASMAINAIDPGRVDLVRGPWFEPVSMRRFDRIMANPPFVVGPPTVTHSYRDSGLDLDGASERVVSEAHRHLAEGGTACLLASWIVTGGDWRERIASWIPDHGVDAWVVQRDVADPALYVGTWLRDAGYDPRHGAGATMAQEWLDYLDTAGVTGIGFGFVFVRSTGMPTDLLAEEMSHAVDDPLGDEAAAYLDRVAWLRTHDIGSASLIPHDGLARDRVSVLGDDTEGWTEVVQRISRSEGPRWSHEVDDAVSMLIAGLAQNRQPGRGQASQSGPTVDEVIDLLVAATGASLDRESVDAAVRDLVRHGLLVPDTADNARSLSKFSER